MSRAVPIQKGPNQYKKYDTNTQKHDLMQHIKQVTYEKP